MPGRRAPPRASVPPLPALALPRTPRHGKPSAPCSFLGAGLGSAHVTPPLGSGVGGSGPSLLSLPATFAYAFWKGLCQRSLPARTSHTRLLGQHQRVLLFNDIVKFSNLFPDLACSLRRLEITDASPGSCTLTTPGDFLHGNPGIGRDVVFLASSFLHLLFPFLALLMSHKDTNTHFKRQDHSL